ncbi:hypothetical protein SNK04_014063 [Fusarium graminearum]
MSDTSIPNNGGQGGNEGGEGGQGGAPSLLNQGVGNDWLPEKFRTVKEGGSDLDRASSGSWPPAMPSWRSRGQLARSRSRQRNT